jgi:hypothetical protein
MFRFEVREKIWSYQNLVYGELLNLIVINNSLVLSSLHQTLQVWNERSSSLTIGYQNISESNRIGIYLEEKSIGLDQL